MALSFVAAPLVGCAGQPGSVGSENSALTAGQIIVAQIYGGGGNPTEALTNDYVVLYNTTTAAIALTGTSVYVNNGTVGGTFTEVTLTGSIPASSAYLISGAAGTAGAALPTPDVADTSMSIADTKGTVAINTSGSLTPTIGAIDLVGWGTSNAFTGTAAAAMASTSALIRNSTDCTTSTDNATDFTVTTVGATKLPPNSAATIANCSSAEPATPAGPDMTVVADMTDVTGTQDLAGTTPTGDMAVTVSTVDGGDPTGNQPSATNGSPPTYAPGGNINGAFGAAQGRGFNGCSVGGNGASTPWFAGLLIAGFALAFRRRRTA